MKSTPRLSVTLAMIFVITAGCASVSHTLPPAPQIGIGPSEALPAYRLQPGDVIELHILSNPEMNEQAMVAPDGRVTFQFAPSVAAGGNSLLELTETLTQAYGAATRDDLQVVLRSQAGTHVYVTGEVTLPSEVVANGQLSALSAITRAGGFKLTAQRSQIVLLRRDEENKPRLYTINLTAVMEGKDPGADVLLQTYDVLYVPRDRLGNVSLVFEKIRNALPIGASISYGYYATRQIQ